MTIIVYGLGCPNCKKLEENVFNALANLDVAAAVEKCTDLTKISQSGVWRTPGLSINGEIVSQGKVLAISNIEKLISERLNK